MIRFVEPTPAPAVPGGQPIETAPQGIPFAWVSAAVLLLKDAREYVACAPTCPGKGRDAELCECGAIAYLDRAKALVAALPADRLPVSYTPAVHITDELRQVIREMVGAATGEDADPEFDDAQMALIDGWQSRIRKACAPHDPYSIYPAPSATSQPVRDLVLVPRDLIGAACAAIDKERDAPNTLAELRRYTTGDPSASPEDRAARGDG